MASVLYSPGAGTDAVPQSANLLSPNESPKAGPSPDRKPDDKDDLVQTIKKMHLRFKQARAQRDSKWGEYWDFYNGKQWPVKRSANRASPNVNVIRSVVQTVLPILTDTSPSFGLLARDPSDFDFADLLTEVVRKWWGKRSMNHVLVESLMDACVVDVGILKVVWNDELDDGMGDVEVTVRDPSCVYVPETAVDFDRNCPVVIDEFYLSRGRLCMKFPDYRDEIKNAPVYGQKSVDESKDSDMRVKVVSPVDRDQPGPDNKEANTGLLKANDELRVWEVWLDDDTVIEEEEIDQDGDSQTVLKKKYPHGRVITMLPDANCVVQDIENPYRDGDKPFVRLVDTLIPRCFYGDGEVAPLMESQKLVNKVFATLMDWANLMSNPCWVVDNTSGVDPDMLTNDMGQIIVKNPNTTVQRLDAPPIPPQMFELYHTLMQLLDQQSGVHEVTQGRKPVGVTAAQAIETLQEAAQTRIRLKERNLLVSLQRLGRLIVSRMLQYYTEPRVIELTGRDDLQSRWPSYIKFYVEHVVEQTGEDGKTYWAPSAEGGADISYRPMTQKIEYDEGTEQYVEEDVKEGSPSIGQFEIEVTTGSSMPYLKEQRSQLALRMFENKAIDRQALLEVTEWPEKEQILNRIREEEESAKQAQSQQAPPQQPPM